jgi:hypothetical protein
VIVWLVIGQGLHLQGVESPVNLPVSVAVLPEKCSQKKEKHLCMEAVLIKQDSSPIYQCGEYDMPVGWIVMRTRADTEIGVGRFTLWSREPLGLL